MSTRLRPAGFWLRYVAWSLDAAPLLALALAITRARQHALTTLALQAITAMQQRVFALIDASGHSAPDPAALLARALADPPLRAHALQLHTALLQMAGWLLLAYAVLALLYFPWQETSAWRATPGKRALRLQVCTDAGAALGYRQALGRHLAATLSWLSLNLGHALAALRPDRCALHDLLSHSRVVLAAGASPQLPGWARAWLALQVIGVSCAVFALAMMLAGAPPPSAGG